MNIAIAQSGGPTCAINASLAGAYYYASECGEIDRIYGSFNGIEGILKGELTDLSTRIHGESDLDLLIHTPSAALGSCRHKLAEYSDNHSDYDKIKECFYKYGIKMFFYIGGNDSMDTVNKLSKYFSASNIEIKVIGIPKTIDNDLCGTDHSPGFGSAAKYVCATVQEISRDSRVYAIPSVTVVEVMGRHAGWLTASCCCLRANKETAPHLIYLPETPFCTDKFIEDVKLAIQKYTTVIVAVSEGVKNADGKSVAGSFTSGKKDAFGHAYLSGVGKCLEELITEKIGCKVRSVELNVMQRCSSHIASATDLAESEMIGAAAVGAGLAGKTGCVMTYLRENKETYSVKIGSVPACEVANHEKLFPKEWINEDGNGVLDEAIGYFLPLIQGEVMTKMRNGMPWHFELRN